MSDQWHRRVVCEVSEANAVDVRKWIVQYAIKFVVVAWEGECKIRLYFDAEVFAEDDECLIVLLQAGRDFHLRFHVCAVRLNKPRVHGFLTLSEVEPRVWVEVARVGKTRVIRVRACPVVFLFVVRVEAVREFHLANVINMCIDERPSLS